jgi:acyl carrier protein
LTREKICAIRSDIDSVDFLNFVIGLHKALGVEIPDAEVSRLMMLDGGVAYLRNSTGGP